MAPTYTRNRLVLGGPTAFGESWSIGLAVRTTAAMSEGALSAWLEGIQADVANSYYNTGDSMWGGMAQPNTRLAYLAAYHYDGASTSAQFQARYDYPASIQGGGSGAGPLWTACCCTLLTGFAGRSGRGRVYVPADSAGYASGQFGTANVDTVGRGMRDLIDHINGSSIAGESATVIVASSTGPKDVTRVRVDSLPDTQRTRADSVTPLHIFDDNV